jgi:hypothetical protein
MNDACRLYILNEDGEPEPCPNPFKWVMWMEHGIPGQRIVLQTHVGDSNVLTVFIGTDRQCGDGPPILWETMILGGPCDQRRWRYATKLEALHGHGLAMQQIEDAHRI